MNIVESVFIRAGNAIRFLLPIALLAGFVFIGLVNIPAPVFGTIRPFFVVMYVYYWSIYRPTLVYPALCFGVGLAMDLLSGVPTGMNAIILVAVRWLVSDQRRFLMGQPYMAIWAAFALVVFGVAVAQWLLFCMVAAAWISIFPMLAASLLTFLLFPLITLLLIGVHRLLPVASRARDQ